jgi:hypothetical protein
VAGDERSEPPEERVRFEVVLNPGTRRYGAQDTWRAKDKRRCAATARECDLGNLLLATGKVPPSKAGLLPASALFFEDHMPNQAKLLSPPRGEVRAVRQAFERRGAGVEQHGPPHMKY